MNLQGHKDDTSKADPLYVAMLIVFLDSTGVWLLCLAFSSYAFMSGLRNSSHIYYCYSIN